MTGKKGNRINSLIEEGGRSYPDALLALAEFRRQVREKCRSAFEGHLGNLTASMGLPFTRNMIRPYAEPENLSAAYYDGNWASVGIQAIAKENVCSIFCALEWNRGTGGATSLCAYISLFFKDTMSMQRAWEAVKPYRSSNWGVEGSNAFYVSQDVNPKAIVHLEKVMEQLLKDWNRAWMKVGGLATALKMHKPLPQH